MNLPADTYNYERWRDPVDFSGFRSAVPIGTAAPDISATLLETGETVRLSQYWAAGDVLVEFGAVT